MRNMTHSTVLSSTVLSTVLLLAACSSTKLDESKTPIEDRSATNQAGAAADPRSVATVTAPGTDPLNDPKGVLARRSVYFDYDSYIVKDDFKPVIDAHSRYLGTNKGRKVIIQGNTDDRGGREYNLALGQKRAEAVRKSMSLLGVPESQMEAVSLGKEKPKATGSDEAAYAENRRADIVY
ncbi:MAG: peptidoglycan-associated lipoprotein Pal [Pseudomonadota bacterium]